MFSNDSGVQVGEDTEAGGSIQFSNAKTVGDMEGYFYNESLHGGDGVGGSVDYFTGNSNNGPVVGGGITFGAGEGTPTSVTRTDPYISTLAG